MGGGGGPQEEHQDMMRREESKDLSRQVDGEDVPPHLNHCKDHLTVLAAGL